MCRALLLMLRDTMDTLYHIYVYMISSGLLAVALGDKQPPPLYTTTGKCAHSGRRAETASGELMTGNCGWVCGKNQNGSIRRSTLIANWDTIGGDGLLCSIAMLIEMCRVRGRVIRAFDDDVWSRKSLMGKFTCRWFVFCSET